MTGYDCIGCDACVAGVVWMSRYDWAASHDLYRLYVAAGAVVTGWHVMTGR